MEFEGLPAGPRVEDSDAIIVVVGRSDVLNLLRYGVKNAIAVEVTNVPDSVAELTQDRTVTAFLDGDRGGDLIRKELAQVGDIDYVAFSPANKSVEDLGRHEVMSALRSKRPFEKSMVGEDDEEAKADTDADATPDADPAADTGNEPGTAATDGSARPAPESEETGPDGPETTEKPETTDGASAIGDGEALDGPETIDDPEALAGDETAEVEATETTDAGATETADVDASEEDTAETDPAETVPATLRGHVEAVIDAETGIARLLNESFGVIAETAAENAFDAVEEADEIPYAIVLDGTLDQRVLDVSAQRGVGQVVAAETGEFVKQPADVRIRTAEQF